MWFEIIPSFAIVVAAMAAPTGLAYALNWIAHRNTFRRSLISEDLRMQYLRDIRVTGNPYKVAGLENIPDEDPEKECDEEEKVEEECEETNTE